MKNLEGKNVFKDNLKALRQEAKIGQVELAEKLGVSKGVISFWENGINEPGLAALIKIADFFEVSIDYLVGRED